MNQTRTMMLIALVFLGWMLFTAWHQDYGQPPAAPAQATAASTNAPGSVPDLADASSAAIPQPGAATTEGKPEPAAAMPEADKGAAAVDHGTLVQVDTDVLHLVIDTRGASIVEAELKAYPESLDSETPVKLLTDAPQNLYVAQSGLVSTNKMAAPSHKTLFDAQATNYQLADGQDRLEVAFTWQGADGVKVVKTYTLERGSYVIRVAQQVENHSTAQWQGFAYRQLQRVDPPAEEKTGFFSFSDPSRYSFFGAGWYSTENKFSKLKFEDFKEDALNSQVKGGWLGMLQHYFLAAWIPPAEETDRFATKVVDNPAGPRYLIRAISPVFSVAPGATGEAHARLFIGPKLPEVLETVAPHFDLAVDYGKLTIISKPLHWILSKFEALTGNWGFAIILLLLLIKLIFFKLSEAQYRSMAKMRKLQPKVKALKERYPDDKQKQQQAMMELYKKEKANPMAGCLPMLIQLPIFFALYYMLMQSVELRQAPFIWWIHDLSAPDPFFVLPVLCGALMLGMQMLTPMTGMDPTQAKLMKIMPVGMSVFFAFFPAGLVLYYCTNNLISLIQMWIIMRRFEAHEKKAAA